MKTLLLIGYGAMGRTVREALRLQPQAAIACILETPDRRDGVQAEVGSSVEVVTSLDELAMLPDLALECAGHGAVARFVPELLARGVDTIVASVGALADEKLHERLEAAAVQGGSQLILVPGAIAGIDALAAACARPVDEVVYTGRKPPRGWFGTPAEAQVNLRDLREAATVFEGNARDAARLFPQNANVAAMVGLAGIGMDRTRVSLVADPAVTRNTHTVSVKGEFGELHLTVAGNTLPANPKTSALAAFSILRAIRNRVAAVVI